ncbi:uncharacterized protein A4U43_C02F15450 [Asparagus officinalis]|uniref:Uncharacterized protein n=1 Tax=Asparagus officinalis TaxID=4686 RepID=A0A5P1FL95_ASPOF|nr:uncharacterized protein A4U43_C02F15450 [Asparagus officinalis]
MGITKPPLPLPPPSLLFLLLLRRPHPPYHSRRPREPFRPCDPDIFPHVIASPPLICRSDSLFLGRKVPALSASDKLQPGHSYFLLPTHFFHSVLSFVTLVSSSSSSSFAGRFDIERTEKGMVRVRVKDDAFADDGGVGGGRNKHFDAEGGLVLEGEKTRRRLRVCDSEELERECRQLVGCRLKEWKPRLETIMESSSRGCRRRSVVLRLVSSRRRKEN